MGKDIGQRRRSIKPAEKSKAGHPQVTGSCVSEAIDQGGEGADRLLRRNAREAFIAQPVRPRFDTAQKSLILRFVDLTILRYSLLPNDIWSQDGRIRMADPETTARRRMIE